MRARKKQGVSTDTREHLLVCAKGVFSQKGYHQASIADIIESAGVARGTYYLYFKSKREIFDLILDRLMGQIDQRIKRIELAKGKPSFLDQLKSNIVGTFTLLLEDPELIQIMLYKSRGLDRDFDEKLDTFYKTVTIKIRHSLQLGMEMGLIRECDSHLVSVALLGQAKEVLGWLGQGQKNRKQLEAVVDELLAFGLFGLFPSHGFMKR